MILSFQAEFVPKIQAGTKIFTLREDKPGRWKKWNLIHFYRGNPRNGGQMFCPINTEYPWPVPCLFCLRIAINRNGVYSLLWPNSRGEMDLEKFAIADGFDSWEDFCAYHLKDDDEVERTLISWLPENQLYDRIFKDGK